MSTKKLETTVCVCVEVKKIENLDQKIAVLEVVRDTLSTISASWAYYAEDEKVYADQGYEESSKRAGDRARAYEWFNELLGAIAEKI